MLADILNKLKIFKLEWLENIYPNISKSLKIVRNIGMVVLNSATIIMIKFAINIDELAWTSSQ